jgi:hypothetical protein
MLSAPLLADFAHVRPSPPTGAAGEDEDQDGHKGNAEGDHPRHRRIMTDSASRRQSAKQPHTLEDEAGISLRRDSSWRRIGFGRELAKD